MTPQSSTNGNQKTWQVGEIADETGLSVRTLHHYEEIGLLSPASRGENSYRLYDENDLARLQQIVSLKQLGFSLDEIKQCLASPDFSPEKTMAMHLQQLEEQMKTQEDLKERLDGLLRFPSIKERPDPKHCSRQSS
jgi:DNA-binding transcriptional MerR regulator